MQKNPSTMTRQLLAPTLAAALWLAAGAAQAVTCLSGIAASNPDNIYTVHGDGTVTDTRTGLMWKQCLEGYGGAGCIADGTTTSFTWANALAHAESHTFAGYTDWRLPNQKELRSLVEECRRSPAINDAIFGLNTTLSSVVWSGSPLAGYPGNAWVVYFLNGGAYGGSRDGGNHVRLVRGAPLPALSVVALQGTPTASSATVAGTSSLAAIGYWLVVPSGSAAPTPAQVKAQAAYGSVTPVAHGSAAMQAATPASFAINGLTAATDYDFYLVADAGGQLSTPVNKVAFTTAAAPVNGSCGTAHTAASATEPASALCSTGTASSVIGSSGAWGWSCDGSGGGGTATCSAPYASQTLTVSASNANIWVGGTSAITANSSAGLAVTLAGNTSCSVSGTTATGIAVGTCTVTASQDGTGDVGTSRYLGATAVVNITVSAVPTYTITATASPVAGGTVSCSANPVTHGSNSTCTATANAGYSFSAFSGDCTGATCTLTNVTAAKSVTATFTQNSYAITATASPVAGGTVSCSANPVTHGSNSTCTATANAGYSFSAFSGDCTGATCTLTNVTAAKSVTATFTQNSYAITATASPVAGGTVSCSPSSVTFGGSATCTATPANSYRFNAWTGACAGQSATCTLNNIQAAQASTAVFSYEITVPEGPWTGQPIVVTPPAQNNWVITSASTAPTSSIATPPPSTVELPHGIVALQLATGTAGSSATVVLTYPEPLPAGTKYYKFGKTLANPIDHWYEFSGAVISGNTITLTLTDGGAGDNDLKADSLIDDLGGPALLKAKTPGAVQSIPTLSEWGMMLLTGLLGLFAAAAMRRGRSSG